MTVHDVAVVRAKLRLRETFEMLSRIPDVSHKTAALTMLEWVVGACVAVGVSEVELQEAVARSTSQASKAVSDLEREDKGGDPS